MGSALDRMDGNDYWVSDVREVVRPRVIAIERNVEFGDRNVRRV